MDRVRRERVIQNYATQKKYKVALLYKIKRHTTQKKKVMSASETRIVEHTQFLSQCFNVVRALEQQLQKRIASNRGELSDQELEDTLKPLVEAIKTVLKQERRQKKIKKQQIEDEQREAIRQENERIGLKSRKRKLCDQLESGVVLYVGTYRKERIDQSRAKRIKSSIDKEHGIAELTHASYKDTGRSKPVEDVTFVEGRYHFEAFYDDYRPSLCVKIDNAYADMVNGTFDMRVFIEQCKCENIEQVCALLDKLQHSEGMFRNKPDFESNKKLLLELKTFCDTKKVSLDFAEEATKIFGEQQDYSIFDTIYFILAAKRYSVDVKLLCEFMSIFKDADAEYLKYDHRDMESVHQILSTISSQQKLRCARDMLSRVSDTKKVLEDALKSPEKLSEAIRKAEAQILQFTSVLNFARALKS